MHKHSSLPFFVACFAVACFTGMDALMKGLSITSGVYNAMLWRMLAGSIIGAVCFFAMRSPWPTRAALSLHVRRGVVSTIVGTAFFWGIVRVPLAEGISITFVAPLIALYLAALLLGESISGAAIVASLLGLSGVLTIAAGQLRLDHDDNALAGMAALLLSAVFYGYNLILQRRQAQLAKPVEIAFFQNLIVLCFFATLAPFLGELPAPAQLPHILGSAGLAFIALGLLAWSYARAEAQVLLPVEYTAFIWAALLGWLMFDEKLSAITFAGTALIVAGCIIANYRRRGPPQHVETTAV